MTSLHTPRWRRLLAATASGALALALLTAGPASAARPAVGTSGLAVGAPSATAQQCTEGATRFVADRPPALVRLSAERAWTLATGKGVVVAVIDSGVSARNVHFPRGSVLPGKSFVGGSPTVDTEGHGTAIAGQIAARSIGAKSGVVGIAPGATILPVKIWGGESDDEAMRAVHLVEGIVWAADQGADLINISMSTLRNDPYLAAAVAHAERKGAIIVASAGNRDTTAEVRDAPRYPAAYPGVIGVAATDAADVVTEDSIHGSHVTLAAPGQQIVTAFRDWGDCVYSQAGESTSYATAYVTGSLALLKERFPKATPAELRYRLEVTAARAQRDARDDRSGWGVVQPYEALTYAVDSGLAGPPPPDGGKRPKAPVEQASVNLRAPVDALAGDRSLIAWILLGTGASTLGLAMLRMLRRHSAV
jgi:membrane-anchored mycosin MYCP